MMKRTNLKNALKQIDKKGVSVYKDKILYGMKKGEILDFLIRPLSKVFFSPNLYCDIKTFQDYERFISKNKINIQNARHYQYVLSAFYSSCKKKYMFYPGYCDVCNKNVNFEIIPIFDSRERMINWRENLLCPYCGFSNRHRYAISIINEYVDGNSSIYVTERVTNMFNYLDRRFKSVVGSEYLGYNVNGGEIINGIRNEDLTNLSFDSDKFDTILSFDVLEHVPDYKKAICNVFRCLKKDGLFIFTVPFLYDKTADEIRTIVENGLIKYVMVPEIHGNPLSDKGSLVYTIPGWGMIDYINEIGFSSCHVRFYYSAEKGYFSYGSGVPQVIIIARK